MRPDFPSAAWGYLHYPYYDNECQWCKEADKAGFDVDGHARPGDIAVIPPACKYAKSFGHVVYVRSVDGSKILISGMDYCQECKYNKPYNLNEPGCSGTKFIHWNPEDYVKIIAGRTERFVDENWRMIPFGHPLETDNVYLFAGICSEFGRQPAHLDIRNVNRYYFEARVEEDHKQYDGIHTEEEICYIAVSENASYLPKRGSADVHQSNPAEWDWVSYGVKYEDYRPLGANIFTENGGHNVHLDINAKRDGFHVRLEEDPDLDGSHTTERVDWVVWKTKPPPAFQSWYVEGVTHKWKHVEYPFFDFWATPAVVARISTENGGDCAIVDIRNVTIRGFDVRVEECRPCGGCGHTGERIDWAAADPFVLEW